MAFTITGLDAMLARLHEIVGKVEQATPEAMMRAGFEVQREAQRLLSLSSHPPGTPTPSAPGQPPSMISGALRRSITVEPPEHTAEGWRISVGPTIVYGRIQELGGQAGNGSTLPPRPYMAPAYLILPDKIKDIFQDAWSNAVN